MKCFEGANESLEWKRMEVKINLWRFVKIRVIRWSLLCFRPAPAGRFFIDSYGDPIEDDR